MRKYTIESSIDSNQFEIVRWDEPINGVRNGTVVYTTTDPEEAETMCDEYIVSDMEDYYLANEFAGCEFE